MADRKMNARIQHKHDTEANWLKATNFIPLEGELIIYDGDENNTSPRFKVGDGETVVSFLPFTSANSEGSIVDGDFAYFEDIENTPEGSAPSLDADSLGGIPASSYMTSDEIQASYVKASIEEVIMGEIVKTKADFAEEAIHAVNTDEAIHANEADRALETDNSLMLGGKEPKYYVQPRNLLDNSDFRNPINQRGYTVYNTNGYTIDRWLLYFSDWANFTIENGLVFNVPSAGCSFFQRIVAKSVTVDAKYTLAYMLDGAVYAQEWIFEATENESYDVAFVIPEGTHTILWAALYEGSYNADNLPPYQYKGYAAELAECKRYYQEIGHFVQNFSGIPDFTIYFDEMISIPNYVFYSQNNAIGKASVWSSGWIDVDLNPGNMHIVKNAIRLSFGSSAGTYSFKKVTLEVPL